MSEKNFFETLYDVDVRDRMEKKSNLTYLPWATAWSEVAKRYPDATYEILKFGDGQLPYTASELGIMVYTKVTINNITREMCLPVMDGANKAMKTVAYTYEVAEYERGKKTGKMIEKSVAPATMFDINKSIMRCLAKNLAMFGLGLHLWTKEEAPENTIECAKLQDECYKLINKKAALSPEAKEKVAEYCKEILKEENGDPKLCDDSKSLKELKKKLLTIRM